MLQLTQIQDELWIHFVLDIKLVQVMLRSIAHLFLQSVPQHVLVVLYVVALLELLVLIKFYVRNCSLLLSRLVTLRLVRILNTLVCPFNIVWLVTLTFSFIICVVFLTLALVTIVCSLCLLKPRLEDRNVVC